MAYIVGRSQGSYVLGDGLPAAITLPPHQTNDVLYLAVQHDGGTGTISLSGVSGWVEITTQAAHGGQRTAVFRKVAASGNETPPSINITVDDDFAWGVVCVRGADTTTPENASTRVDKTNDSTPNAASVTTTSANCLVLWIWGYDNGLWRLDPVNPEDIQFALAQRHVAGCLAIGWTNQVSAGATPTPEMQHGTTTVGGTVITIAVNDDGSAALGPRLAGGVDYWKRFTHDNHTFDGTTWDVPSALAPTSIGGITLDTTDSIATSEVDGPPDSPYDTFTLSSNNNIYGSGETRFAGVSFAVSATNLTGKLVGLRWGPGEKSSVYVDPGFVIVFQDGSANWKAIQVAKAASVPPYTSVARVMVLDPAAATAFDSAGSINWANITRVGLLVAKRSTTATARRLVFRHLMLFDRPTFVGGSAAQPLRGSLLRDLLCGWLEDPYVVIQGERQVVSLLPIQFGDGSAHTHVDTAGMALEPHPKRDETFERMSWVLGEGAFEFRIKASATDKMYVRSAVVGAGQRQRFVIDPASSASADYDFSGLVLVEFEVDNDVSGVTMNGTVFRRCHGISLLGGGLGGCRVEESQASPAVTTSSPANISNCEFVSSGTGHAIEITQPGTYTFAGNTFEGYGANGTTDAAIYNNSGGAVTLNITGGGDTPTVRNGTGASTTVNNNVSITIEGLVAGSALRVERVSDNALMFENASTSTSEVVSVAGGTNYRIKVRKGTSAPKYQPFATQTGTLSGDTTVFVQQIPDLIAA